MLGYRYMDDNQMIYGRHPVKEFLSTTPARTNKIFIQEDSHGAEIDEIKQLAKKNKIPVSFVDARKLRDLIPEGLTQGIVAEIQEHEYLDLDEFLQTLDILKNPSVVILDELDDAHNIGAIIRTSAAAGVSGIIVPKHRQAPISGGVYKTSAGTVGKIPIIRVGNINQAVRTLKDNKFWIFGLDEKAQKNFWEEDMCIPVCFIAGNEHTGIREKTKELCDFLVSIPMEKQVESLNVSVSTALVVYEWKRQNL